MDTAYKDNNIDKWQRRWLDEVLDGAGEGHLILFSHHPLFSNFKDQGEKIARRLHDLLTSRRVTAWYWGHEHHAVVYGAHPAYGFLARSLGHGGMPYKRKDLKDFPVERQMGGFSWRRGPNLLTPPSLYVDGPNPYIPEHSEKYGPHGYMTLEFDGASLTETVHSADGAALFVNHLREKRAPGCRGQRAFLTNVRYRSRHQPLAHLPGRAVSFFGTAPGGNVCERRRVR